MKWHQTINLPTKIAVMKADEAGNRVKQTLLSSLVCLKAVSIIIKNKNRLHELYLCSKFEPGRKCLHLAAHNDLEEPLFSWFRQTRNMNVSISGPILKLKAKELAMKLGHDFACSTG